MKYSPRATALTLIALPMLLLASLAGGGPTLAGRANVSPLPQGRCAPSWVEIKRNDISFPFPARVRPAPSYLPNVPNLSGEMYRTSSGGTKYTVRIIRDGGAGLPAPARFQNFRDLYRQSLVAANGDGRTRFVVKGGVSRDEHPGEQLEVVSGGARIGLNLYLRGDNLYALEVAPLVEGDALAQCFLTSLAFLEPPSNPLPNPKPTPVPQWPTPRPTPVPQWPTPNPTPMPTQTPTPELTFTCDCGQNLVKEVSGNRNEHELVVCEYPEMCYPKWLVDEGVEGTGKLLVKFPAIGTPQVLRVLVSVHPVLDQCAIEAIQKTAFCPETHDGVAVDSTGELPFTFDVVNRTVGPPAPTVRRRKRP